MAIRDIKRAHRNLQRQGAFRKTSNADPDYNCVAWAAGDTEKWWWPWPSHKRGIYWPVEGPNEATVEAFVIAFGTLNYRPCSSPDLEEGFEKVAIYVKHGVVKHMARQLRSGLWTSKVGELEDITHRDLEALEDEMYGTVAQILTRPRIRTRRDRK